MGAVRLKSRETNVTSAKQVRKQVGQGVDKVLASPAKASKQIRKATPTQAKKVAAQALDVPKNIAKPLRQVNPTQAKKLLATAFDKALEAQAPLARKNVERLRRVHPDMTPAQMIQELDKAFLTAITLSGGAAGGAAAAPGAGVPAALADMMVFTEASVLYVLSLAEVHNLHPEDLERRKLLVLTVLMGDAGTNALSKGIGRVAPHWAKQIVKSIPMARINQVNKILGPRFVTKYGSKQGVLVLGKQVPLGIGAVLGAGGNHLFGRFVIRSAKAVFGRAPRSWPDSPAAAAES